MPAHLLQLANMHREGPGSLDVVFGVDGDFEGAPRFTGPLVSRNPRSNADRYEPLRIDGSYDWDRLAGGGFALDLRIPSVATRMAGLCARALGSSCNDVPWRIRREAHVIRNDPAWRLLGAGVSESFAWTRHGDAIPTLRYLTAIGVPWDDDAPHSDDPASFLASLTLTLAPRIAALPASARSR